MTPQEQIKLENVRKTLRMTEAQILGLRSPVRNHPPTIRGDYQRARTREAGNGGKSMTAISVT